MSALRLIALAGLLACGAGSPAGAQPSEAAAGWFDYSAAITADAAVVDRDAGDATVFGLVLVEVRSTLDTARAGWWADGQFGVALQATFGGRPTRSVGDFQGLSNIEAPARLRLFEAWYEHGFEDAALRLRCGLQDANAAFNVLDAAALFLNSSFGITPELSQVEPSIFPDTSLGLVLEHGVRERFYVLAGTFDARAETSLATRFRLGEGWFSAFETGYSAAGTKAGIGAWYSTRPATDAAGAPHNANSGYYAIAETTRTTRRGRVLSPFVQLGRARADRNVADAYAGAGLVWSRVCACRQDDRLGLAAAIAREASTRTTETVLELSYEAPMTPRLTLQPDVQVIWRPGFDHARDAATAVTLRLIYRPGRVPQ